jgi:hypothetical protein
MTSGPKQKKQQKKDETKMIMQTRQLMQQLQLEKDSKIPDIHLVKKIREVRSLDPRDNKTPRKWINRLLKYEFIRKCGFNMYLILDTGKSWWD